MLHRSPKLAALAVLALLLGICHCEQLRGQGEEQGAEIEHASMEEIMAEMELRWEESKGGGLRKSRQLREYCDHEGQDNQVHTWLGRSDWDVCSEMNHCMCGMDPARMATWCPKQCNPMCGGTCATPDECRSGFNIIGGQVVPYYSAPFGDVDWNAAWGPACTWFNNPGAPAGLSSRGISPPSPTPPPPPPPDYDVVIQWP